MSSKPRPITYSVDENGCWICTSHCKDGRGRPRCNRGGEKFISRYIYKLHFGDIPKGMCVCHHCDNPACINPQHFFLGTHQDNIDDRERKGRNRPIRGEKSNLAKLTKEQVLEIREYLKQGIQGRMLAIMYGVGTGAISSIKTRRNWRHI